MTKHSQESHGACAVRHSEQEKIWSVRKNFALPLGALRWLQETLKTEHFVNTSGSNVLSLFCLLFLSHFPMNPPTCFNSEGMVLRQER